MFLKFCRTAAILISFFVSIIWGAWVQRSLAFANQGEWYTIGVQSLFELKISRV